MKNYHAGLRISGHNQQINVGDSVTITCSFDLNLTSIEWLYNNTVIMSTLTPQLNLTFNPVNESINNRQYTCRAVTLYGTQDKTITIQVQGIVVTL